jgi:ornithine--oxo-acid transaminase
LAVSVPAGLAAGLQYKEHVNPQWSRLLDVLEMRVRYTHCSGVELLTEDGRVILDFLSGYCVHNTGHNHPAIVAALKDELDSSGPAMLQSHVPELAGELAAGLCRRAGGRLRKVFFASSGTEGVEAAIKFARARTGRSGMISAEGAFHGLTCGALSLMSEPFWRGGFGPLLPDTATVPFGDFDALERRLSTRQYAAFIVEPIQGEAGIRIPDANYLLAAQAVCRRYGSLFVLDEVQTGLHRTGPFLAAHHYGLDPDMVVLAKALSGGLVPTAALLMTDEIYGSVFNSLKRSIIHTSTYSENGLSMRAGLATLLTLDAGGLGERSRRMGDLLRSRLRQALSGYQMVREVRGEGLFNGIEFQAPRKLALRVPFEAFKAIHPGMFGQIVVMRLYRDHGILTQMCGNNFLVLKATPPLVVEECHIEKFVAAVSSVVELMHTSASFWTEALGLARRVADI